MIRRPPRSTLDRSSAASDVYKRQVPEDGPYVIEIKDAISRGRPDFVYRIAIGELPFVTSIFPLGGRVDGQTTVEVKGHNSVSYTHLRAHETVLDLVCRLLLEKKKHNTRSNILTNN